MEITNEDISKMHYENNFNDIQPMENYDNDNYKIDFNIPLNDNKSAADFEHITDEKYYLSLNSDNKVEMENKIFTINDKILGGYNIENFKNIDNNGNNFNNILLIFIIIVLIIVLVNIFFKYCLYENNDNNYNFFKDSSSSSSSSSELMFKL
jgi:hypothetical protein